jgi:hypothetical protein
MEKDQENNQASRLMAGINPKVYTRSATAIDLVSKLSLAKLTNTEGARVDTATDRSAFGANVKSPNPPCHIRFSVLCRLSQLAETSPGFGMLPAMGCSQPVYRDTFVHSRRYVYGN